MSSKNVYQLSIIIPFFNIDWSLLKECLDSITCQLNEKVEVIIIDDGSNEPDTYIKCKEYIACLSNVMLVANSENSGVSFSRNRGIELASGSFITFVDADDCVEDHYIQSILDITNNDSVDTVFFELSKYDGKRTEMYRKIGGSDCTRFNAKMVDCLLCSADFNSPCTIVYSKNILTDNNIRFDQTLKLGEDFKFNYHYFKNYKNAVYLKKSLYVYRTVQGSATTSFSLKKMLDSGAGFFIRKELICDFFCDSKDKKLRLYAHYLRVLLSHLLNGINSGMSKSDIYKCLEYDWVRDVLSYEGYKLKEKSLVFLLRNRHIFILKILAVIKKIKDIALANK